MQHNNLSLQHWKDRLTVFWILGQEKTIKVYWNEKIYWDIMLDYIWLKINFRSNSSSKRRKSSGLTRETLLKTNSIRSVSRPGSRNRVQGLTYCGQKSVDRLSLNEYGKTDKLYFWQDSSFTKSKNSFLIILISCYKTIFDRMF